MFRPNRTLLPSSGSSCISQALQGLHNLQEKVQGCNWQTGEAGARRSRVPPLPGVLEGWRLLRASSGAV